MSVVTRSELDTFVRTSDELGGLDSPRTLEYWADFRYQPTVHVDTRLDPDSEAYMGQMLSLYQEISGRNLDPAANELTAIDVHSLVDAHSPYLHAAPGDLALHYLRLAKIVRRGGLPARGRVLDLGCGWGMSSELLAQLGFQVCAVDINPQFVELVRRRTQRLNLDVEVVHSAFDEFEAPAASFDAALFYESFHHAVNPGRILRNIERSLKPGGKLLLAGEPIQELYWPGWGLRLDPLSVYCIRKFGWFESGWSRSYLSRLLARNDLLPWFVADPDNDIGLYAYGIKDLSVSPQMLASCAPHSEWWPEPEWLVSNRRGDTSTLSLHRPRSARSVVFEAMNFGPDPLAIEIAVGSTSVQHVLRTGRNEISVQCGIIEVELECRFVVKSWCPGRVLGNGDIRELGFHLAGAKFV